MRTRPLIRNRQSHTAASAVRTWILTLHRNRSQAEPRLTRKEIRRQLAYQCSEKTIGRHIDWLRQHGHLPR
jgi:hypothetical protein